MGVKEIIIRLDSTRKDKDSKRSSEGVEECSKNEKRQRSRKIGREIKPGESR